MDWKRKAATLMMVFLPLSSCGGEPGNYSHGEIEDAIQKAGLGNLKINNNPPNGSENAARWTIGNIFKENASVLLSKQRAEEDKLKESCSGDSKHGYFVQPETGNVIFWNACV